MKRIQQLFAFPSINKQIPSILIASVLAFGAFGYQPSAVAAPVAHPNKAKPANNAFSDAESYMREIFGSPVPAKMTAAELAAGLELGLPLPGEFVDNGPAPVPMAMPNQLAEKQSQQEKIASAPGYMNSRALLWPMRGGYVSSRFGYRWGRPHKGTDIAAPVGTPIFAAAAGRVVFSGWQDGYGKLVIVDHGNGTQTKYGHCADLLVGVGTPVKQGAILGKVGMTGRTTGPHLHYEVVRNGVTLNPEFATRKL